MRIPIIWTPEYAHVVNAKGSSNQRSAPTVPYTLPALPYAFDALEPELELAV